MNFDAIVESKVVAEIGWTLVHSVWKIGIV